MNAAMDRSTAIRSKSCLSRDLGMKPLHANIVPELANKKEEVFDPIGLLCLVMSLTSILDPQAPLDWPQVELRINQVAGAFEGYRGLPHARRIGFLRRIADEIAADRAGLVAVCQRETNLPEGRLQGEIDRTINQIKLFASLLEDGSWVNAIIDTGDPGRTPIPKPDIRQVQRPIGAVCVYGASNFPFAFSVAGGDTISALAAGCPVLYKVHMAHPETSWLVSQCIERAAEATEMPTGVFVAVAVQSREVAYRLVSHPAIRALAFTGSFAGGKALYDVAVRRPDPIPVYAEMGSINPVFLLPGRLREHAETTAAALAASNALGAGQFCTNPGLLLLVRSPEAERFLSLYGERLAEQPCHRMLTPGIHEAYVAGVERLKARPDVTVLAEATTAEADVAVPVAFRVNGRDFLRDRRLSEECFGPASIHVVAESAAQLVEIAQALEGQLTASVWCTDSDIEPFASLFGALEQKAGRLIVNGAPTGVEVCHAMVHGGPFPATTDARTTSVGSQAIYRFTRPVSFQNYPERLLPAELQGGNPRGIWRKVDGEWTKAAR